MLYDIKTHTQNQSVASHTDVWLAFTDMQPTRPFLSHLCHPKPKGQVRLMKRLIRCLCVCHCMCVTLHLLMRLYLHVWAINLSPWSDSPHPAEKEEVLLAGSSVATAISLLDTPAQCQTMQYNSSVINSTRLQSFAQLCMVTGNSVYMSVYVGGTADWNKREIQPGIPDQMRWGLSSQS